jgi:hypothetical protein
MHVATLQMTLSTIRQLQDEELDIVGGLAGTIRVDEQIVTTYCYGYTCPPPPAPSGCIYYQHVDGVNIVQTSTLD